MSIWEKIGLVAVLAFQAVGGFIITIVVYVYIRSHLDQKKEKRKNEM